MTMPEVPYAPPMFGAQPPPPAPRRNIVPILVVALVAALVAVVVLLVLLLTSGDSDDNRAGSFTLSGTFSLTDGATDYTSQGECEGTGGYDDISEGTQVTVYGSGGEVLGTGNLGSSNYLDPVCEFEIAVEGVPSGHDFYQVEVSHRGKIAVSADEARDGLVALTLG
jgi:hypothetical protein